MTSEFICEPTDALLSVEEAMRRYRYENRQRFLQAVKALGIPCVRVNARHFLFDLAELKSWERSRSTAAR